ncbi:MAG: ABC transporter ATP-binding protein [Bacteroidota bacterium]|nr:ABC transporter ATP-binding protein [Candidatus Kapabacteria bacterium]MDW8220488.1 ABC transporter ATP-binding protein [Bacteroidota bacterium]
MEYCISLRGLSKTYKNNKQQIEALKPIDLDVARGEIFGLLGPNGAGKTTMIKLMLGIIRPTSGSCFILGEDIASLKAKQYIGYLPENHRFPLYLTGQQMLEFYGNLSGLSGLELSRRIDETLELVKMTEWRKLKIQRYSKGMMQRIGLAQALLNRPKLLLLDEPTDGIDPVGRMEVRRILEHVRGEGTTIFVNSHLLSEVELITDRVAILRKGVMVKLGNTHELTQSRDRFIIKLGASVNDTPANVPGMVHYDAQKQEMEIVAQTLQELNTVIDTLRARGYLIEAVSPKKSTLEEIFMTLMEDHDTPASHHVEA